MMTFHFLYTYLVFYLLIMNSVPNFCQSLKYCFRMLTLSLKVFSQGPSLYSALLQSRLVRFCLWQAVILGSPVRKSGGFPLLLQYVGSPISHISCLPFLIDFFKLVAHIQLPENGGMEGELFEAIHEIVNNLSSDFMSSLGQYRYLD